MGIIKPAIDTRTKSCSSVWTIQPLPQEMWPKNIPPQSSTFWRCIVPISWWYWGWFLICCATLTDMNTTSKLKNHLTNLTLGVPSCLSGRHFLVSTQPYFPAATASKNQWKPSVDLGRQRAPDPYRILLGKSQWNPDSFHKTPQILWNYIYIFTQYIYISWECIQCVIIYIYIYISCVLPKCTFLSS